MKYALYDFAPTEMPIIKKILSIDKNVKKLEPSHTADDNVK